MNHFFSTSTLAPENLKAWYEICRDLGFRSHLFGTVCGVHAPVAELQAVWEIFVSEIA